MNKKEQHQIHSDRSPLVSWLGLCLLSVIFCVTAFFFLFETQFGVEESFASPTSTAFYGSTDSIQSISRTTVKSNGVSNQDFRSSEVLEAIPLVFDARYQEDPQNERENKTFPRKSFQGGILKGRSLSSDLRKNLLQFQRIQIQGIYRLEPRQILRQARLENSPWIWEQSFSALRRNLRDHPWIDDVELSVSLYPLEINLKIFEAEPWIIAEYERHSWLVSRSGNLIQPLDTLHNADLILETTELSRLDGLDPQPHMASYLASANARFVYAVKLMKLLHATGDFPFEVARYTLLPGGGMQLSPETGSVLPMVLVSAETFEDAERVMNRLRGILSDLSRRGERVRRIDLRFHNQAVVE